MSNPIATCFSRFVFLVLTILTVFVATVFCQTTGARPDRGVSPGGVYSVSDIENINLQNGNVNLSIPLASLPPIAGGKLGLTLTANYNSKIWNVMRQEKEGSALPYRTYTVDVPTISDVSDSPDFGGWVIGGSYRLFTRVASMDFDYAIPPPPEPGSSELAEWQRLQHPWYKLVLQTPDGAEHELRPIGNHEMYQGVDHPRSYLWGYFKDSPDSTGSPMRYYSTDGTYLSAIINPAGHSSGISWTMFLPDGTQVIQYAAAFQRIRDNNGNSIKIFSADAAAHYQDEQTGREIRVTSTTQSNGYPEMQVWYQTVGGIDWQHIDINFAETTVQGKLYRVHDWNPGGQSETGEPGVECVHHQPLQPTTVSVVRSIVFPLTDPGEPNPDRRTYSFEYNSDHTEATSTAKAFLECGGTLTTYTRDASIGMGAISHMETPSGSAVDYHYSLDHVHNFIFLEATDGMVRDTLTTKTLTHDGTAETWTYHIENNADAATSSVDNPDGSIVSQNFYPTDPGFALTIGSDNPRAGRVFHTSNGLTETYQHWTNRGVQIASGSEHSSAVNSFVDAEYTSYVGTTLMSAKTYQYDYNGNLNQVKEYDWFDSTGIARSDEGVPTAVPATATLLRETHTSYYNSAADTNSPNYYMTRSLVSGVPSILNATREITVGPSITRFGYDLQAYDMPPTLGNLTSQSVWDDVDAKWITSSQTYGQYGNLSTKTDPRGKVTQFFYDDATHARPNRVEVNPENGTGQQIVTIAYDFATGLVTSQTDPNQSISSIDYTNQLLGTVDPFGRPGITLDPTVNIGGANPRHRTTTTYFDHSRQVVIASDLNSENDKLLKSRTTTDTLGRVILSEQSEDGTTYTISSQKAYQQLGKITYVSSPVRSGGAGTDSWARANADEFGRTLEIATFAGSNQPPAPSPSPCLNEASVAGYSGKVCSSYDAVFTTVTDQAGKQRRSKVDALGRLVRVDEPRDPNVNASLGSTSAPAQATSYEYDVFGNLTKVIQDTQTRTFTYDSLSRMRSATNPESGTVTYTYDDNGNLLTKTDARLVVTTYTYDALNRNTSVTYTNDPAATPMVTRSYDGATNGKGRLWKTETSGTAGSRTTINAYNAVGSPTSQSQQFYASGVWSAAFTMSVTYGLNGQVLTLMYPSGHMTSYTYDSAGRTSSFAGNLGEGVWRTYANQFEYTASGALQQEKFGTDTALYHKQRYNSRGQLWDMRLSTKSLSDPNDPNNGDRGSLVNYYSNDFVPGGSGGDNNGNLLRQEINIPGSDFFQDSFAYDSLNRLTSISEKLNGTGSESFKQAYTYDRFGNRTIDQAHTTTNVPHPAYTVDPAGNNRLVAPAGYVHEYDAAGNQTRDNFTADSPTAGYRTYDAENRIIAAQKVGT
ncbi:MAG TPA: hypothetical protein VGO56_15175, partial [Pyrinomonadaceae bacterium]|nr:hypothetical protein [Pyrinomonadaceae bacterium]